MQLVILESPFRGRPPKPEEDRRKNIRYARRALRDCAMRGESAIASHLLWPQCLDDNNPEERALGMFCGIAWARVIDHAVFYTDRGWSEGMRLAVYTYTNRNKRMVLRALDGPVIVDPQLLKLGYEMEIQE